MGHRVKDISGMITRLFLLVLRSIEFSILFYREIDNSEGQLACHHTYEGIVAWMVLPASVTVCRARLSVVCASSRDVHNNVTPTVITPLTPVHSSSSTPILFPQWPHKGLFKQDIFSSISRVIFTDTSVPPLQFSSWRRNLDTHIVF